MLILIIRILFFITGAIAGYQLVNVIKVPIPKLIGIISYVIIGSGVGYVLGGVAGRWLVKVINWIEVNVQKIPSLDLIIGALGLIIGLILATLISWPLRYLPSELRLLHIFLTVLIFIVLGYLGIRLSLRKREDFRGALRIFSQVKIPKATYFSEEKILDTSVIIDGRIADICETGFIGGRLNVPRFILKELQKIADSEDSLKRNRGRRGLDILGALQREPKVEIHILEQDYPELSDVDAKLVRPAKELDCVILTNDYNLNKVAELQGVRVLNINELANALKPVVLPGEEMSVRILREGKEAGQGVGYLDDGTMVVVDGGKKFVGRDVEVLVTSVLQTPAGRMIFTKLKDVEATSA